MKTYITRINGGSLQDKSHHMQHMVAEIAHQLGCREMGIYQYYAEDANWESAESLNSRLDGIIGGINRGDIAICQFPTGNGTYFENELVNRLKVYGARIAILIHEMEALAYEGKRSLFGRIIEIYNQAEVLIVPTYAMRQWLLENGISKRMKFVVQEMWDYTVNEFHTSLPTLKKEIFFTDFEGFDRVNEWNYSVPLKLYNVSTKQGNVQNLGEREPYQLLLELNRGGGFGLIWYRDEYSRRYMGQSNSFSLSRFLAAGLPVLVPVDSSHRRLIEANHLGIVVESLEEAVQAVERISEEKYREYGKAVEQFAPALRSGYFTKKCLIEAMQAFYRKDAGRIFVPERAYNVGECVFKSETLNESYGGNLAFSWDFQGDADGLIIYDADGALLEDIRDLHQHYFLLKGFPKEKGVVIKAYVETLRGKLILAETRPVYLQEKNYGKPKVSMVIPAYNAEDYIARCLDTVLAQSQENVEIIVVDDGSKDCTPKIIDWYAEVYENIVAIHQENGGVAAARNTGILYANGEYIGFVDNDDMIRPDMVKRLYQSAKKNDCDIAMTSVYQITKNGYEVYVSYVLNENIAIRCVDFIKMLNDSDWMYTVVIWNKLYRASLIKNRLFPLIKSDDSAWTPYILSYADTICYLNDYSYEYDRIIRPNTLVDEWHKMSQEARFETYKKLTLFYLENGNPERIDLLKNCAKKDLAAVKKANANNEYEKLWRQIEETF